MFFCEPCREERDWPGVVPLTFGRCEVCEQGPQACYDIPSSRLPIPADNQPKTAKGGS